MTDLVAAYGPQYLVAGRSAIRSDPRCLPHAEHVVESSRALARQFASSRSTHCRGLACVAAGQIAPRHSAFRFLHPQSTRAQGIRRHARSRVCGIAGAHGRGSRTAELRERLLALPGVGQETADAILLYALHHPVPVADEYLRRIVERHQSRPASHIETLPGAFST